MMETYRSPTVAGASWQMRALDLHGDCGVPQVTVIDLDTSRSLVAPAWVGSPNQYRYLYGLGYAFEGLE
jgi:hypothetical protein